jgi:hypothetical protein
LEAATLGGIGQLPSPFNDVRRGRGLVYFAATKLKEMLEEFEE